MLDPVRKPGQVVRVVVPPDGSPEAGLERADQTAPVTGGFVLPISHDAQHELVLEALSKVRALVDEALAASRLRF